MIPSKVKVYVDVPGGKTDYVDLPDLPSAEKEAKAVAQLLNTEAIVGKQATESLVVKEMQQAKIIHLATHGILRANALIFTTLGENKQDDNPDDGLLNVHEIANLDLNNAELVVLSACETGLGYIGTEGVIGLVLPFLGSGVPSVVVSLWLIPDSPTSELMVDFYKNLKSNPDKAQALRQAMLTTMKKHPDPVNWAAFTLVGEAQ
ncbi:MAG: CHAT domain-containing protein [Iphinoe sp. HA4291-MV1]|nr:CHAT domain-containing protein [Iphinoe sp. HA4291-MV1]